MSTLNTETLSFSVVSHPTVPSIQVPNADLLLHADCNEQEVVCEISRYVPRGAELDSLPAHFMGSVQLEGGGISLTLVLQTLHSEPTQSDTQPLMQSKLNLPLSQSGTLQTEGNVVILYLSIYLSIYLSMELCVRSQNICVLSQNSAFPPRNVVLSCKTFALLQKYYTSLRNPVFS